jgi:hypothetical protein
MKLKKIHGFDVEIYKQTAINTVQNLKSIIL